VQVARGDYESAMLHLKAALALTERHGLDYNRGLILAKLIELGVRSGDYDLAQRHAASALESAQASGNRYLMSFVKLQLARFALRQGDLARSRAELAAALDIAIAIGQPVMQLEGVGFFAELLAAQGEPQCASLVSDFAADAAHAPAAWPGLPWASWRIASWSRRAPRTLR
jgi:ATP/maltotriose-dependent transcriptional regulator MalT